MLSIISSSKPDRAVHLAYAQSQERAEARLRRLREANAWPVTLTVLMTRMSRESVAAIQACFLPDHMHDGWFRATPELDAFIRWAGQYPDSEGSIVVEAVYKLTSGVDDAD
jgi:hypothetical protein